MLKCPSCGHSWLFGKREISVEFNPTDNAELKVKNVGKSSYGEMTLTIISWSILTFLVIAFIGMILP